MLLHEDCNIYVYIQYSCVLMCTFMYTHTYTCLPMYLMFIATLLIITSHYSITVGLSNCMDFNITIIFIKTSQFFIVADFKHICIILFLLLVPFNIILLFTRTLSRFQFINKFKPLLDAYQGP